MTISKKRIEEYGELYKKRFGKEISQEEALEQAISLVNMVKLVYKPIKKSDLKSQKNRQLKIKATPR